MIEGQRIDTLLNLTRPEAIELPPHFSHFPLHIGTLDSHPLILLLKPVILVPEPIPLLLQARLIPFYEYPLPIGSPLQLRIFPPQCLHQRLHISDALLQGSVLGGYLVEFVELGLHGLVLGAELV